jgi:transposase
MSTWVYVSIAIAVTTAQEDTRVRLSIQMSSAPVKAVHARWQQAYRKDDVRVGRRTTVLLDLLGHHVPLAVRCARWGLSSSCLYDWQRAFRLHGMESLPSRHRGGRRPKLPPRQKKRLVELRAAGPQVVGCETAWWTSGLVRVLLWREFGVLSNRQSGCTLLHHVGVTFQQARCVSAPLDAACRHAWRNDK